MANDIVDELRCASEWDISRPDLHRLLHRAAGEIERLRGQPMSKKGVLGRSELLALLRDGVPHREVYRGQDGGWWVTYGGGEADARAVAYLVEQKYLTSVYSSTPDEVYHVGKTFDCNATLERRKREGRKAPLIYIGSDGEG